MIREPRRSRALDMGILTLSCNRTSLEGMGVFSLTMSFSRVLNYELFRTSYLGHSRATGSDPTTEVESIECG